MKNKLWLIAVVTAILFCFTACEEDSGGGEPPPPNQTPVESDYTIGNLNQTSGSVTAVSITPNSGKSTGVVSIKYDGETTLPQTAGTYAVTFDVAKAAGWNAAADLSAGNLVVIPVVFDNIPAFATWLEAQPANTAATTYSVELNVDDLGGSSATDGSVGLVLYTNRTNKYVSLDLSGSTITGIVNEAFNNCSSLTSVTIPDSVESIGERAFGSCTSLTSVTIPDSVTIIGSEAFLYCTSLTSVTIPNSVTSIGRYAFYGCRSLASITIPDSVNKIEYKAFSGCTSLTSVTFEGTISSSNFDSSAFGSTSDMRDYIGDLRTKFYATDSANGTPGTYTRPSGGIIWTKQN